MWGLEPSQHLRTHQKLASSSFLSLLPCLEMADGSGPRLLGQGGHPVRATGRVCSRVRVGRRQGGGRTCLTIQEEDLWQQALRALPRILWGSGVTREVPALWELVRPPPLP